MAERIAGTRNDIKVSQTRTYPLQEIAVPTLVIHGTEDPLLPFQAHGKKLASEIPGARLLAVEGGGHGAIFTHRDAVRSSVVSFLEDANPDLSSVHSTRT
jgi:pimeloyl-ACP methyl ester carboxylesterase